MKYNCKDLIESIDVSKSVVINKYHGDVKFTNKDGVMVWVRLQNNDKYAAIYHQVMMKDIQIGYIFQDEMLISANVDFFDYVKLLAI